MTVVSFEIRFQEEKERKEEKKNGLVESKY
jgi:hypothetical protein